MVHQKRLKFLSFASKLLLFYFYNQELSGTKGLKKTQADSSKKEKGNIGKNSGTEPKKITISNVAQHART